MSSLPPSPKPAPQVRSFPGAGMYFGFSFLGPVCPDAAEPPACDVANDGRKPPGHA
jgi:hypothetical protein